MHAFLLHVKCVGYTLRHAKRYLSKLPDGADQYFAAHFCRLLDQIMADAKTVGFDLAWYNRAIHVDMADDCARITLLLCTEPTNLTNTTNTTSWTNTTNTTNTTIPTNTNSSTNTYTRDFVAKQTRIAKQAFLFTSLVGPNMFWFADASRLTELSKPVYLAFCNVGIEPCSWHDATSMFGRVDQTGPTGPTGPTGHMLKTIFPTNWHSKLDEIVRYKPFCALFTDQLIKKIRFIKTTRHYQL
jgi:hypothetical protein